MRSALWTAIEGGKRPSHLRHAELVSASIKPNKPLVCWEEWTLKQVQGDDDGMGRCWSKPVDPYRRHPGERLSWTRRRIRDSFCAARAR
ncbi:hypothetical protein EBF16_27990 [Sphingobium yanoikuyae]|uniref:Uncharacterized protein n=1 Tax=Sphingobium yanoikuyae TaxID=13690 RepID=A0A3G2UZ61_SPHYA|nr:hypothetical protein EBF16_27990 [Sphingobium yanoikuyae]